MAGRDGVRDVRLTLPWRCAKCRRWCITGSCRGCHRDSMRQMFELMRKTMLEGFAVYREAREAALAHYRAEQAKRREWVN